MSVSETEELTHSDALKLEVTCSICLQLFSEPLSLPCGHIFCLACLRSLGEGLDQSSCPDCHATYQGTSALVKNVKMCSMVEAFKASYGKISCDANSPEVSLDREAESTEQHVPLDQDHSSNKCKMAMDKPKFHLASQITELNLKLEMAEGALRRQEEQEREMTTANAELREKMATLLQQMKEVSECYSAQVMEMIEEEIGPGEAAVVSRLSCTSELTMQLRQAMLRAESLLTEDDETAFSAELRSLQPHIVELLEMPAGEEEEQVISKVNPSQVCAVLENMNTEMRESLGEIQRSLRNTLNPSEVTFDPETAHPNLLLSEDLKTVTFSATKQPYPSSPRRFTSFFQVLSTQSFSEGEHSWTVELDGSPWIIGMCYSDKLARSGLPSALESSRTSWCLMWYNNLLTAFERGHDVPLKRTTVSPRLEVKLSFKTHRLSFYHVSPVSGKTHVYTFKADMTEPVHLAYRMMSGHPKGRVTVYS